MDVFVFFVIIVAALGHAVWNGLLKGKIDPQVATTMLAIGGGVVATPLLFFVGMPAPAARPYIAASVLIHVFYWSYLGKAYASGELSQVYPIARGAAPVLTALGAVILVGEYPTVAGWLGILTVAGGVIVIAILGGGGIPTANRDAVKFAIITALSITAYSLNDGIGAREAGSAFAYIAFLYVCNGYALLIYGLMYQRQALFEAVGSSWHVGLLTGTMSLVFYGIGVWAMTQAPIGIVAALREISILFALAIGFFILKEPVRPARIAGACLVFAGLVAIRLA
jgi:drug/metabolite transporter (DMT)-like permease